MKIKCKEHYDKVVEYAKSIGDKTLQRRIEELKQWEKNSNGKCEIELYWDIAPYSFGRRRAALSRQVGRIPFPNAGAVPRLEHTHVSVKN